MKTMLSLINELKLESKKWQKICINCILKSWMRLKSRHWNTQHHRTTSNTVVDVDCTNTTTESRKDGCDMKGEHTHAFLPVYIIGTKRTGKWRDQWLLLNSILEQLPTSNTILYSLLTPLLSLLTPPLSHLTPLPSHPSPLPPHRSFIIRAVLT